MLDALKPLGVTQFIPVKVPEFPTNTGSFGVERTAFFEEHARAGRMKGTRGGNQPGRSSCRRRATSSSSARA